MNELHYAGQGGYKKMMDGDERLRHALGDVPRHGCRVMKHLFIYKNQLMFDIDAQVSMIVTARRTEQGTEANAQSDMIDRYKGMFDRWIDKYVDKVKERLVMVLVEKPQFASGDELRDWSEKELLLSMPEWWDENAWKPLVSCVHDYIVNSVLGEYLSLVLTGKDPVTVQKKEDAMEAWGKIKVQLTQHLPHSIKRPLRPLGF